MAQVLTLGVPYTPARPWSVVACRDWRQLYEYLYPRSIILVSEAQYIAQRRNLLLLRLALPQAMVAVVDGGPAVPRFLDTPPTDRLDAYVAAAVCREHQDLDTRPLFPRILNALFPPRRIGLVIFDMDGTLLKSDDYSYEAYRSGLRALCRRHGLDLPDPARSDILPRLGVPGNLYRDLLPEDARHLEDELRALVRERFNAALSGGEAPVFPQVREVLAQLRAEGRKLALVSHSPATYFRPALAATGLEPLFEATVCVGERPGKGKADLGAEMLERIASPAAAMVGDRRLDIEAGRANDCLTVGAGWGFAPAAEELHTADAVLADITELPDYLNMIEHMEET